LACDLAVVTFSKMGLLS